ncbi:MAG: site-specific DNA-methyltransferase [Ignavibacteriae bacterium]|nr:site-specific DNA-methyltransferase [Ignavibacteriota bacterium]
MKNYKIEKQETEYVMDALVNHISKYETEEKESFHPAFKTNDFCLYNADCLAVMSRFPDNGFTCHAGRMVSVNKGKWDKSKGFDEDFKFHETWISECKRILKPEGSIWISGTYHSIFQCGYILQKEGYHILNDISWFKPNASPNLSCRFFTASHETLIWARKDKKAKHYFNYTAMKEGSFPNDFIKKPSLQMRSVWAIHPPKNEEKTYGKHPTQKPIDLLKRVILASTDKDAIILDPFSGSGTTGIAAKIIGDRKFIGIEYDEKYIKTSISRYNDLIKRTESQLTLIK